MNSFLFAQKQHFAAERQTDGRAVQKWIRTRRLVVVIQVDGWLAVLGGRIDEYGPVLLDGCGTQCTRTRVIYSLCQPVSYLAG